MARPSDSKKWTHSSDMTLEIKPEEEWGYSKTDQNGYPKLTKSKWKTCTVILGVSLISESKIKISSKDHVWTCKINYRGNPSSIGIDFKNKDITYILHN